MKKIITIILGFLVLSGLIVFSYINIRSTQEKKEQVRQNEILKLQKNILQNDDKALSKFSESSSAAAQDAYVAQVNNTLSNPNLTEETQNSLNLRKAIILSELRGDAQMENKVKEATDIFNRLIQIKGNSPSDIDARNFSIVALSKMQLQCCFTYPFITNAPIYASYNVYKAKGYKENLAKLMLINDLTRKVDPAYLKDLGNIASNSYVVKTIILQGYANELSVDDKNKIVSELGEDINNFENLQPLTFDDYLTSKVEPNLHLAAAYDTYVTFTSPNNPELNKIIDAKYIAVKKALDESPVTDGHAINLMKMYNAISHITSIDHRYGNTKDGKALVTKELDDLITAINYSKETKDSTTLYFKLALTDSYLGAPIVKNFLKLGLKYPNLLTHYESIGITKAQITSL